MTSPSTIEVLNRLLTVHERSLPLYLSYASPWPLAGDAPAKEVLGLIVADQKQMADRIGKAILDEGGMVSHGRFPMHYTSYHDLTFEYLVKQMIVAQKRDIAVIQACVFQLENAPALKALAEEALGAAKGHLESLEELTLARSASEGRRENG